LQVARDSAYKTAFNWNAKTFRQMTRRKALGRWETKVCICEFIPQALWPIAKSLMERGGPKAPTVVHRTLEVTNHPNEKANVIADCLGNQFTSHARCDEKYERWVKTTVQALFASADDIPLEKLRPCGIHYLANLLKLRKVCGLDGIPNECLRYLPRRSLVCLTHFYNH
jgi:hypothetical protein